MDNSSLKLAGAAIGGIVVIGLIYLFSALLLDVPASKVLYTYGRYVALFLGASLTVWIAGKFVAQYNSGWFLPIIFIGIASIFFAWIAVVGSNGTRTMSKDEKDPQGMYSKFAPRTVAQLEGKVETPAAEAPPATSNLTSVDAAKKEVDELLKKYELKFDDKALTSETKIYEAMSAALAEKKSKGVTIPDADVFKIQNYLILEFRKKEEEKAKAAAPAAEAAPAPKAAAPEPTPDPKATAAAPAAAETPVVAASLDGDPLAHEAVYKKKCAACHSLAANAGKMKAKHMKSPETALKLVQWMQKLAKQDRSKNISDDEAQKIAAFIMAPGAKLY
ncbi:MAG: hypothetical protein HY22_02170 [[Candidatus Thermochlorobacteriaceae] bacterium GBChlB]|nr:MAG: hypothetical protein HY22_02170 [[Candidatus Thermochlorobacteriaceae] bacterium GBChlB]